MTISQVAGNLAGFSRMADKDDTSGVSGSGLWTPKHRISNEEE